MKKLAMARAGAVAVQMPRKHHEWIENAGRRYQPLHLVLLFFSFCTIGYVWEVLLDLLLRGQLVNRGMLYGPWLPIYGVAGLLMVLVCRPLAHRPPAAFVVMMGLCGTVEYTASWLIEAATGKRWWDYSTAGLDLDGRICLVVVLFFAVAGMAAVYGAAPKLDDFCRRFSQKAKVRLCVVLCAVFALDVVACLIAPNTHAIVS